MLCSGMYGHDILRDQSVFMAMQYQHFTYQRFCAGKLWLGDCCKLVIMSTTKFSKSKWAKRAQRRTIIPYDFKIPDGTLPSRNKDIVDLTDDPNNILGQNSAPFESDFFSGDCDAISESSSYCDDVEMSNCINYEVYPVDNIGIDSDCNLEIGNTSVQKKKSLEYLGLQKQVVCDYVRILIFAIKYRRSITPEPHTLKTSLMFI
ncbi:hypothetical protein NQ315_016235 [Exocentrus adspersus]|uniref:Uncharacterized protein n=1 Tax=Exocentrus adspersus TaxID=1586481 RepID=A0AAV8VK30_9CUCU|nr:hypothetical protein NQ315_016235 [Exocentrus adspersus]